jgi:hypothetical protein
VQKAIEFCNEVKALGEKLLSTLEKKDAEELSLLRSQHEIQFLEAVKEIRKKQIDEAKETVGNLNKAFELADARKKYYDELPKLNGWETTSIALHGAGILLETSGRVSELFAAVVSKGPDVSYGTAGSMGSPLAIVHKGGTSEANAASKMASGFLKSASIAHSGGSMAEAQGSYTRRDEENKHLSRLAEIEKKQIQFQINAAMIRQTIAEKELENQELQIENSRAVDDYMRNKFSNNQLYSWMVAQISTVYFQAYQLAFDMAKKAEKCYQHELGIANSNIIQFGYWDSLKKGLLSGDKLMHDLRRLEAEYINQNKREFEITKHISLAQMAPLSLITLKQTGQCILSLPEWLFDMDYPGHYMRRIKNVSLSIPCIVGPYTGINCTLSILRNETRMEDTLSGGSYGKQEDDTRFKTMFGAISSIATSHAQYDSGMFELNFNDERYLPFEGAGVISEWQINLPLDNNYFDFASLSDVILHIRYTSRNGGGQLAIKANDDFQKNLPSSIARLFSLKHDFSEEWYKFLNPVVTDDEQEFVANLNFKAEHYPFFVRGKVRSYSIKKMDVFVDCNIEKEEIKHMEINGVQSKGLVGTEPLSANLHHFSIDPTSVSNESTGKKVVTLTTTLNLTGKINDTFILIQL